MNDRFPDIEIYIRRPVLADVVAWLDRRFGVTSERREGDTLVCLLGTEPIECAIVENAVKGGYMSVWFRSQNTPWASDLDCAREALAELGLEIRCSKGSWDEDDEEDGWLRVTPDGESSIGWQ